MSPLFQPALLHTFCIVYRFGNFFIFCFEFCLVSEHVERRLEKQYRLSNTNILLAGSTVVSLITRDCAVVLACRCVDCEAGEVV